MQPFSPQTFISRLLKIKALFFTFRMLNVQMCQSRTCSCISSFPLGVTGALLPLSLWIWSQIYFPAMKIIQSFSKAPRPPPGRKMLKTAVPPMTTWDTTVPTEPHNTNTESLIHSDCLRRKEVIKVTMWGLTMDENFTLSPNVLTCVSLKQHDSSKILQSNQLVMSQWAQPSFIYSLWPSRAYNSFETVTFHTEKREKSALATHNFQNQKRKRSRTKPQESLIFVSIHIKQVVIWIMQSTKNRKNCDTPWERICISLWSELKFM